MMAQVGVRPTSAGGAQFWGGALVGRAYGPAVGEVPRRRARKLSGRMRLPPWLHEVYAERYIPWAGDMARRRHLGVRCSLIISVDIRDRPCERLWLNSSMDSKGGVPHVGTECWRVGWLIYSHRTRSAESRF